MKVTAEIEVKVKVSTHINCSPGDALRDIRLGATEKAKGIIEDAVNSFKEIDFIELVSTKIILD